MKASVLQTKLALGLLTLHLFIPSGLLAQVSERAQGTARDTGVSAIWILANLSYAGMRAQNHPSVGWRILSFIFGFPGTLVSFLVVPEGSERAYGIDLPRRAGSPGEEPAPLHFVRSDKEAK